MTPVRIGILGAGATATTHAAAYAGIAEATVVGVFSRDPARARSTASICNAEPFSDAAALIASVDAAGRPNRQAVKLGRASQLAYPRAFRTRGLARRPAEARRYPMRQEIVCAQRHPASCPFANADQRAA